jgi:organic radical activating enzyme
MIIKVENNQPDNVLRIEYMLGNTCNQKCNYCFPGSNEGNTNWPDLEIVKTNLSKVLNHYAANGKDVFNIFFVGGEPTLWDDFLELCIFLKSKYNCILEISTNGTRGIIWWQKAARVLDHINISVHHEYAKINKIKTLADFLYSSEILVNVDVLIDPAAFNTCVELVEQMQQLTLPWPIVAKVVLFDGQSCYTIEQLKYFEEPIKRYPNADWFHSTSRKPRTEITITHNNNEKTITNSDSWITRNNLNYFKGWHCNLGVDHIKITNRVITSNCNQRLFDKTYNINDKDFEFSPTIQPTLCSRDICGCAGEISIKKWIIQ